VRLVPIIRRERQSPNVLRCLQRNSTQEWQFGIDVHDLSLRTFRGDDDMNLDLQAQPKRNRAGNQCSMAVDHNRFAITGQRFTDALSRDYNL
jgi:hypothetical protein